MYVYSEFSSNWRTLGIKLYIFILDYGCRSGQYVWEDHRPRSGVWKGTSGGEAISFSGCDDDQTSADTSVRSHYINIIITTFEFSFVEA